MKRLFWMGSNREALKKFPDEIQDERGQGLYLAQMGDWHSRVKTLSGVGNAKVIELQKSDRSKTYRAIYTVEMAKFIFVLYAFQKKYKSGSATLKQDIDLVKRRLKEAEIYTKKRVERGKG